MLNLIQWMPRPHRTDPDPTNYQITFYRPQGTTVNYVQIIKKEG